MTPADLGSARIRRLIAEIAADRRALEERSSEALSFATRIAPGAPELTAAGALSLDRVYSSFEAVLDRIARSLEGGVPVGPDGHLALLDGARLDIDGVRPAVLGTAAIEAAHEVRRFRHFLRHSYAASLRDERVRELCGQWSTRPARSSRGPRRLLRLPDAAGRAARGAPDIGRPRQLRLL